MFFTSVADNIGFKDDIPSHVSGDELIDDICTQYSSHPSIRAIHEQNLFRIFNFDHTTESEVKTIILKLNTKKASGFDFISPKILKTSVNIITSYY